MSRNRLRVLLLVLIVATLGGVGFNVGRTIWAIKANELSQDPTKIVNQLPEVALQVKDFHRTKIEKGRTAWELRGEEVRYLKGENQALISNPRLKFYDQGGKSFEATGTEGRLYLSGNEIEQMELAGTIRVSYDGYLLETNKASYFKNENRVVAPGKVKVTRDGFRLEGVGMEIALDEEKIRFLSDVKTRFDPGVEEKLIRIADGRKQH